MQLSDLFWSGIGGECPGRRRKLRGRLGMGGEVLGAGTGTGVVRVRGRHGVDARRRRHTYSSSSSSSSVNTVFLLSSSSFPGRVSRNVMGALATTTLFPRYVLEIRFDRRLRIPRFDSSYNEMTRTMQIRDRQLRFQQTLPIASPRGKLPALSLLLPKYSATPGKKFRNRFVNYLGTQSPQDFASQAYRG